MELCLNKYNLPTSEALIKAVSPTSFCMLMSIALISSEILSMFPTIKHILHVEHQDPDFYT